MSFFIRCHGLQRPRDMVAREGRAFLAMLATQHKALASMHNQALSAFGSLRRLQPKNLAWIHDDFRIQRARYTDRRFFKPKMPLALKQRAQAAINSIAP